MCYPCTKCPKLDTWKINRGYIQDAGLGRVLGNSVMQESCTQRRKFCFPGWHRIASITNPPSQGNLGNSSISLVKSAVGIAAHPHIRCFGCAPLSNVNHVGTFYCRPLSPQFIWSVRTSGPEQDKLLCKTRNISIFSLWTLFTLLQSAQKFPSTGRVGNFSFLLCCTLLMTLQEGI